MLDPGHGQGSGFNRGSRLGNEGDNNWEYSLILKKELEKYGIVVGTTRPKKSDNPGLEARGKMAKGYDLFISLHSNAGPSTAKGVEIFPDTNPVVDDHKLAVKLCAAISGIGTSNRGVRYRTRNPEDWYIGLSKAPRKSNYYGVLYSNKANRYAMLIEHVFHTNLEDCKIYVYKRQEIAAVTAKVIAEYYGLVKTDSVFTDSIKPSNRKGDNMIKKNIVIAYWNDGDLANAQALLNSLPGAALVRTKDASIYKEDYVIQVGGFDIKGSNRKVFGRNRVATLEEVTKVAKELKK